MASLSAIVQSSLDSFHWMQRAACLLHLCFACLSCAVIGGCQSAAMTDSERGLDCLFGLESLIFIF